MQESSGISKNNQNVAHNFLAVMSLDIAKDWVCDSVYDWAKNNATSCPKVHGMTKVNSRPKNLFGRQNMNRKARSLFCMISDKLADTIERWFLWVFQRGKRHGARENFTKGYKNAYQRLISWSDKILNRAMSMSRRCCKILNLVEVSLFHR